MKRLLLIVYGVIALGLLVVALQDRGRSTKMSQTPNSDEPLLQAVLGVEMLMQNVDRYRVGAVVVEGVVSARDFANQTLALIDKREFQACGVTTCATLTLPVQWSGPMPLEQETVRVKGAIQELGGKLVFVGQSLEKVAVQQGKTL